MIRFSYTDIIYKNVVHLGCRIDGQEWNGGHAAGRGDIQNHPFRSKKENVPGQWSKSINTTICGLQIKIYM